MIGKTFSLDPVYVMKDGGYFEWAVRLAAARYIAELEKEAMNKNKPADVKPPSWLG